MHNPTRTITIVTFITLLVFIACKQPVKKRYDLIVYGGTPSGVVTSISAAKKGKKVLLIEQTKHLGGMYASGLMTGEVMHMKKECISGLAYDYFIHLGYNIHEIDIQDLQLLLRSEGMAVKLTDLENEAHH